MYSANLIGKQMDTEFGLYLPEYSIPAPEVQTNYKEIPFRDGAIDKTSPDGVVHYKDREWDLTFKKTGATVSASDLAALAMSVMNAIHGKAGEIIFDDDPNYKWVGRVFVTSVNCENNGLLIVNIHMITHPYKYSLADIVVVDEIQTTSTEYEGSIVSLTGGIGKSITELLVPFSPIQDLHGYSKPWAAGAGKNLYSPSWAVASGSNSSVTANGEEIHVVTTGGTTYSGMASQSVHDLPAGTYHVKFKVKPGAVTGTGGICGLRRRSNHTFAVISGFSSGILEYSFSGTTTEECYFCVLGNGSSAGDSQASDFTLYDIIISTEDVDYEPYSNICPITGRTSAKIYRFGKNLFNKNGVSSSAVTITQNSSGFRIVSNANGTYKMCHGGFLFQTLDLLDGTEVTFSAHCKVNSGKARIGIRRESDNNLVAYSSLVSSGEADLSCTYTYDKSIPVYLSMFCTWSESEAGDVEYTNVQLEIGSTVTSYEPYAGDTYAVDWTSVAGTIHKGSFDSVLGPLTKTQRSFDFQGVTPTSVSVLGEMTRFWLYDVHALANGNMLCNMAPVVDNTYYASDEIGVTYFSAYPNSIAAKLPKSLVGTTVDSIRSFLQTGAFQMVQDLVTPVEYQLAPQEIEAFVGTNNIWSTGDSVSVTLSIMDKVTLVNHGKPMNPKINVVSEGSISLLFEIDGTRYTAVLSAGEYTLPDLVLFDGSTDVYEAGEGTITYTYPEVSL